MVTLFLNSAYGSTVQNLVTTSKNVIISKIIFLEPKILKFTSSMFAYILMTPSPNNVRILFSMPLYQIKTLIKLFCYFSYLRTSLLLTFLLSLISNSKVRADILQGQCVKHNVRGLINFWALVGENFLSWPNLKQSSKICSSRNIFLNIWQVWTDLRICW